MSDAGLVEDVGDDFPGCGSGEGHDEGEEGNQDVSPSDGKGQDDLVEAGFRIVPPQPDVNGKVGRHAIDLSRQHQTFADMEGKLNSGDMMFMFLATEKSSGVQLAWPSEVRGPGVTSWRARPATRQASVHRGYPGDRYPPKCIWMQIGGLMAAG